MMITLLLECLQASIFGATITLWCDDSSPRRRGLIRYELQTGHAYDNEYGGYETYGITASRCGKIICTVEDVSLDREKVEQLVKRFNEGQLSPVHLDDMIENFLYDFEV